jgi:hypothetical protein
MRRVYSKPAFSLQPDGSLKLVNYPVHEYPQCSEYRLDAQFHVHRIDSLRARVICRLQGSLADHSAFFSFVTSRIERNPHLVKLLYGLGAPGEGEYSPVPPPSSTSATRRSTPATTVPASTTTAAPIATTRPTSPTTIAAGAGTPPASQAAPVAPTSSAIPAPLPAPVHPLDYPHELTSILIGRLASDVEDDGAQLVVIGETPDLNALDLRSVAAAHGAVIDFSSVMGTNPNVVRFANDGHLNVLGHQRVASFLTPWIAGLLEQHHQ